MEKTIPHRGSPGWAPRVCLAIHAVLFAALLSTSCGGQDQDAQANHRPQQAGQPMSPARTAALVGAARFAALTGDQAALQRNAEAISEDMRRSMRLPDATRPVDHEAARVVARAMPEVVSAVWLDRSNFMVRVNGAQARSERTIAFMQAPRKVDVLDPAARAQQDANAELARRKALVAQSAGDRAAINAIPEM